MPGAEGHLGVVDPLVGVACDEEIVTAGRDGAAQDMPLRRMQILGFVHDHVVMCGGGGGEQLGGTRAYLEVRRGLLIAEHGLEQLDGGPELFPSRGRQRAAAAAPCGGTVRDHKLFGRHGAFPDR